MFLKLPFAVSFSVLFITIQYEVFCKSIRTFYVSLCIYIYTYRYTYTYTYTYIHIYIYTHILLSVEFHGDRKNHKVEVNLATLSFGDITGFNTVVSVCLSYA